MGDVVTPERFPDVGEWQAIALWWRQYGRHREIAMPNYTPPTWWECDVWAVTPAGYTEEIEVKRSVSDFRADARKANRYGERKHDLIPEGRGPNRFSFLLVGEAARRYGAGDLEVPEWAGVMAVQWAGIHKDVTVLKRARLLHREKRNRESNEAIFRRCYYRMWNNLWDQAFRSMGGE